MVEKKKFTPEYFNKLVIFIKKVYPERKNIEESLKLILFDIPEEKNAFQQTLITINEFDEIVGAMFFWPVKAKVDEFVISAKWAYDLVVLEEYRKTEAGILLTEEWFNNPAIFGIGLTRIAKKIYKRIKIKFIGKLTVYIKINIFTPNFIGLVLNLLPQKKIWQYNFPNDITVCQNRFERIFDSNQLQIINDFWNNKLIEFSRSRAFLDSRFLQFKDKYAIYKLIRQKADIKDVNDVYFVVCVTKYKFTNLLHIVDYRFNLQEEKESILLLKAAAKITRKMNLSATLIKSSLFQFSKTLKKNYFIAKNPGGDIITKLSLKSDIPVFVTSADGDQDLPNRDNWFDYINQS